MEDPLAGSAWSAAATVAGFVRSAPNDVLVGFARNELERDELARNEQEGNEQAGNERARYERKGIGRGRLLDLGCGAGRNALPLALQGWTVMGTDLSWPMLEAAAVRVQEHGLEDHIELALAPMDALPARDRSFDLVVAHGIWNLARSGSEMRRALAEAARVARPGAGLFVFTFSRTTLPPSARPVEGEAFVFTDFSGEPQCFLTAEELVAELKTAGFVPDPAVPLRERNRRPAGALHRGGPPVIYEAAFRRQAA